MPKFVARIHPTVVYLTSHPGQHGAKDVINFALQGLHLQLSPNKEVSSSTGTVN